MVDRNEALRELARREMARREAGSAEDRETLRVMQESGLAPTGPANAPEPETYRGLVVPYEQNNKTGDLSFAVPRLLEGIYDGVKSAVTAPYRASTGELPMRGPDGRTSMEAIGEGFNFAGLASPVTPELRSGGYIIPGERRGNFSPAKVETPTAAELKLAGNNGYESLRGIDARYTSQSIADMAGDLEVKLQKQGFNEKTAPDTISTLRELQSPPEGGFATASDLETIRQTFSKIGEDFSNPRDRTAGKDARGAIDTFFASPPPGSVVPGTEEAAAQAGKLAADARANYAAGKRSGRLTDTITYAEDRAGATNSGQNLRQRAADILKNEKLRSGFTEDELASIREVARGTPTVNAARFIGKVLGGGGGLGMNLTAATGGTLAAVGTGNPWMAMAGAVPAVTGASSNTIANILAKQAFEGVEKATRQRSPLYEEMVRNAARVPDVPDSSIAIARAILLGEQARRNGGGGF